MRHRQQIKDRVERLESLYVLRHCDHDELRALARAVTPRPFAEREVLCRAGEAADDVFFVTRGYLGVVSGGELVATLTPGALAGELGPLGPAVRCADLVALTNGEALVASADDLRRLLADSPGLRRSVTPLLAQRADENERRAHV